MKKLDGRTLDIEAVNIARLKELFPAAVEEGRIDFAMLRQLLGDYVDDAQERYSFNWNGKGRALHLAQTPSTGTLRPVREDSLDWDTTGNLYIEGDNLEVLKLLQKSYHDRIKMIYIDPPYNTGNDFIYHDDYRDSLANYKRMTGQTDDEGYPLRANTEASGRFHTDWLNMMYPRLMLARNLLSKDGVIFISIDYNENFNMRMIANEIFGEYNFIGEIYWESKTKSQNTETSYNKLQPKAEFILVYSRDPKRRFNLITIGKKEYPLKDDKGNYREYPIEVMNAEGLRGRESMIFEISDGIVSVSPPKGKQWQMGQEQVDNYKKSGDLFIRDGKAIIKMRPQYERTEKTEPFWGFFSKELGTAESGKAELNGIIPGHGFDTVKPVEIIKRLIYHATDKNDIILDFFSGTGTLAQAVMELNKDDGGERNYICVQLPEMGKNKSFSSIAELAKERIRRAGARIKAECEGLDTGFKVLRLDSSNLREWNTAPDDLQLALEESVDNLLPGRTEEDLVYEIMLKLGLDLTYPIEQYELAGSTIYVVGAGALMIALGAGITVELADELVRLHAEYESEVWQVVLRDGGFATESDKANTIETLHCAGLADDSIICV